MALADELALMDREYPLDGRPVWNIITLAHSGSRSVKEYLEAQGRHTRRLYLQSHWHDKQFFVDLLNSTQKTVIVVRDPLLVILSTKERQDDSLKRLLKAIKDFYALNWAKANQVISLELTPGLPIVGSQSYQDKIDYISGNIAAIRSRRPEIDAMLTQLQTVCRPKLEARGYTNLIWWT